MGLPRTVARFAPRHLVFPTGEGCKLSMRSVREVLELILVAVFTRLTADVPFFRRSVQPKFGWSDRRRVRRVVVAEPNDRGKAKSTDQECFDEFVHSALPEFCTGAYFETKLAAF